MLIRKAKISDVEDIHSLINHYAAEGQMLARARTTLYEGIREFSVVEIDGKLVAAGSLHVLWSDLAEIRALAVAPEYIRQGLGKRLVQAFLDEARELELPQVFALTYKPEFFMKCGFRLIKKEDLPQKVWKECVNCPQFPNCEESAMIIDL
ncbi:GCN5-related N-acetyltransferase [Desulfotomaculum nigrificans CO-1-SRB]|uniref:GCN5-related N-acetyltransferase n=1 Tax=Desulfotomaculum nigrificans (strain DSM 14880 / VKM B-2319 / CO-1-SRB) TaxID=868595 RepID=F6B795_DESCC|nr:N-acetyltransferase [Desulfotomaculum nigrificans]AEF93345.1 GCN5-related N-acetyltransferase [Desulfotomaculum nigrificans CO-1-SRB]